MRKDVLPSIFELDTLLATGSGHSLLLFLCSPMAVWLTMATMAKDMFTRMEYVLAHPRNPIRTRTLRQPYLWYHGAEWTLARSACLLSSEFLPASDMAKRLSASQCRS